MTLSLDGCIFVIGFVILLGAILASTRRPSGTTHRVQRDSRETAITHQPRRDTFTEEEILLPGVDIRRPNARKHIETSRKAQAAGMTPAHLIDRMDRDARNQRYARALGTEADDVIDAEVSEVKQLPSGRRALPQGRGRKLLKG
jgi:hypothetical protein